MNVTIIIPPKVNGEWVAREDKHIGAGPKIIIPRTAQTLAAILDGIEGVDLSLIDAQIEDLDVSGVKERCQELKPDLIITYLSALHIPWDRKCAELGYPTIGIIVHQNIDHLEAVQLYNLVTPFICKNEIEFTVAEGVREFMHSGEISATPGFLIRENSAWKDTGEPPLEDMEFLPEPYSPLFDVDRYIAAREASPGISSPRAFNINTSRGCLFNCLFCGQSNQGQRIRTQSPKKVLKTIKLYRDKFNIRLFAFVDNEFAIDMKRAKAICRLFIEEDLGIEFIIQNRVELFDEELLDLLKEAGCNNIRLGIETCDPKTQKFINKPLDLDKAQLLASQIKARGFTLHMYMTPGIPGETLGTLWMNAGFLAKTDPDTYSSGPLFLMPGSRFYKQLKSNGELLNKDWSTYLNALPFHHERYPDRRSMLMAKKVMHLFYVIRRLKRRLFSGTLNKGDLVEAGKFFRYFILKVLIAGER